MLEKFDKAQYTYTVTGKELFLSNDKTAAWETAYLYSCDNQEIGLISMILGGGRQTKESEIDLTVGIILEKHLGDKITKSDIVATLYANDMDKLSEAKERFVHAYTLSKENIFNNNIVYEVITNDN